MTGKNPNAIVGAGSGVAGGEAAVEFLNFVGVHVSASVGVLIAAAVTGLVLAVGRKGLRGVWQSLLNGTGATR